MELLGLVGERKKKDGRVVIVNANDVSNPATLVPFVVKIREKSSRLRFPLVVPAPAAALGIDDGGRSRKSHNEMPLPPLSLSLSVSAY